MKCPECKGEFDEKESVIINRDLHFSLCDDCFFNVAIEGADFVHNGDKVRLIKSPSVIENEDGTGSLKGELIGMGF